MLVVAYIGNTFHLMTRVKGGDLNKGYLQETS